MNNTINFITNFLTIVEGSVIDPSLYIEVEDCGNYSKELSGAKLCFPLHKKEELGRYFAKDEEGFKNFIANFDTSGKDMILFQSYLDKQPYTITLLKYFESPKEVYSAFGLVWEPNIENEIIIVNDAVKDEIQNFEEIQKEAAPSTLQDVLTPDNKEPQEIIPDEEIQPVKDDVIEEDIPDLSKSDLIEEVKEEPESTPKNLSASLSDSQINNIPNDLEAQSKALSDSNALTTPILQKVEQSEEPKSNVDTGEPKNNTLPSEPAKDEENPYNNVEGNAVRIVDNVFGRDISRILQAREGLEELIFLFTGRRPMREEVISSTEEFNAIMRYLDSMSDRDFRKAMKVVLKRFWRFGEVQVVSMFMNELIAYLEER